jgi:hypothetical protein
MIINKVILCLDNNPNYTCYWNVVSDIWINIYNIDPVLIFVGSEKDLYENNFKHKDKIIRINKLNYPEFHITWALFWATQLFKDEVCIITGIDQIPLSKFFIDYIKNIDEEKYIVGISDCYEGYTKNTLGYYNTQTNVLYPSSHHVAKGKNFKKIFNLDEDWESEINKVVDSSSRYFLGKNMWGLDECYSSEKISLYDQSEIEYLKIGKNWFLKNRIYMGTTPYDTTKIKEGFYSEVTYKPCYNYVNEIYRIIDNLKIF